MSLRELRPVDDRSRDGFHEMNHNITEKIEL